MTPELFGKTAIVTGGGRGIGRAVAEGLARRGADVVICGRSASVLDEAVAAAAADGLAIVVNNAAAIQMNALEDVSVEEFDHTYAVNVRGPMLLGVAALPHLRKSAGAAIVNISSVAVDMGGATMGCTGPRRWRSPRSPR